jgi:hypothetical protein
VQQRSATTLQLRSGSARWWTEKLHDFGFVTPISRRTVDRLGDIWGPSRRFQFVGSSQFASEASNVSGTRLAETMGTATPAESCHDRASNFRKEKSLEK